MLATATRMQRDMMIRPPHPAIAIRVDTQSLPDLYGLGPAVATGWLEIPTIVAFWLCSFAPLPLVFRDEAEAVGFAPESQRVDRPKPVRLDDCRTSYDMPFGFANSLGIFLT